MINIWGWQFWLFLLFLVIFIIWLIWGGKKHEFMGLAPLNPNYDTTLLDQHTLSNISLRRPIKKKESELILTPGISRRSEDSVHLLSRSEKNSVQKVSRSEEMRNPLINSTPEIPKEIKSQTLKYRPIYPQHLRRQQHRSKVEAYCCEIMEDIYGQPFNTSYPDFLRNPETGRKLEIDCYNEDLKIGLEYNGPTHYLWPNYTSQTKVEFIKQIRRDRYKVDACDANGVYLITVPYNVPTNMLKSFIEYYLPENVNQRLNGQKPKVETEKCQI